MSREDTLRSVTIRREEARDGPAIRAVLEAAFRQALEADLVDRLRAAGALVLSLVAEVDGIIGQIAFSRLRIEGPGSHVRALALAPLAVLPGRQRSGLGGAFVQRGLDELRAQGEDLVLVLGDPDYYGRFGFSAEAAHGLATPYDGPALQALWLAPAPAVVQAVVHYPAPFSELG